jgi:hypothetical protein
MCTHPRSIATCDIRHVVAVQSMIWTKRVCALHVDKQTCAHINGLPVPNAHYTASRGSSREQQRAKPSDLVGKRKAIAWCGGRARFRAILGYNYSGSHTHHLSFRGKIRDVGPIMKFQQQQQQIDLDLLK